jgi:hypothetical protein
LKPTLFNPEKSFLHLGVVWFAILLLIIISVIISGIIIYKTPLIFDLSSSGFNYFVSVFRFPLGILTLIIPIVALLAANHRSEQTKEQIKVTGIQNNFANYYKHLEEFIKYFDKQKDLEHITGARYIHKRLYPDSQSGDYALCENLLDTWESANLLSLKLLNNYPSNYMESISDENLDEYISILITLSSYTQERVHISHEIYRKGRALESKYDSDCSYQKTYLSQAIELITNLATITNTLDKLCHFSVEYVSILNEEQNNAFMDLNYLVHDIKGESLYEEDPFEIPQTFEESNVRFIELLKEFDNSKAA